MFNASDITIISVSLTGINFKALISKGEIPIGYKEFYFAINNQEMKVSEVSAALQQIADNWVTENLNS